MIAVGLTELIASSRLSTGWCCFANVALFGVIPPFGLSCTGMEYGQTQHNFKLIESSIQISVTNSTFKKLSILYIFAKSKHIFIRTFNINFTKWKKCKILSDIETKNWSVKELNSAQRYGLIVNAQALSEFFVKKFHFRKIIVWMNVVVNAKWFRKLKPCNHLEIKKF